MKNTEYINASAGTGKTFELTHRLKDYFMHNEYPIKPSQIIVTTYTKAAAAEIKERARKVLVEADKFAEAAALDSASIGTVHGIAQSFIKKYWWAIGMAPDQDVMTNEDSAFYRNQSLVTLFEEKNFDAERGCIYAFFNEFAPKNFEGRINPNFWAEELEQLIDKITYYNVSDEDIERSEELSLAEIDKVFNEPEDNEIAVPYSTIISDKKNYTTKIVRNKKFGNIAKNYVKAQFTLAKAWMVEYKEFKKKKGVIDYDDMEKYFLELLNNELVIKEIKDTYRLLMVDEFQDCNPIQLKIFNRISDILAEGILQSGILEGKKTPYYTTLLCGDGKQSIYGFRGSDTDLVNRVVSLFPKVGEEPKDGLKQSSLDKSYRTRKSLVNFTNGLFRREGLFPEMPEISSDIKDMANQLDSAQNWYFQDEHCGNSVDPYYDNFARNIKKLVEGKEKYLILPKDKSPLRPINYGDIAILYRTNNECRKMAEALAEENIPVSYVDSNIIDCAEVQLVLSLLTLSEYGFIEVNKEKTDKQLKERECVRAHEKASIMRLWNDISTEDVLTDRLLYIKNKNDNSAPWKSDVNDFMDIQVVLEHIKNLDISQKVSALILELGLLDKVKKWGNEESRRSTLYILQDATSQFLSCCSRLNMIPNVVNLKKYLSTTKLEATFSGKASGVKICTYHKSKGLEWPVVFLCSLESSFADEPTLVRSSLLGVNEIQSDKNEKVEGIESALTGYKVIYFPNFINIAYNTHELNDPLAILYNGGFDQCLIMKSARKKQIAEMSRLFYVGATRARDYLFLTRFKDPQKWLADIGILTDKYNFDSIETQIAAIYPQKPKKPTYSKSKKEEKQRENAEKELKYLEELAKYNAEVDKIKQYKKNRRVFTKYRLWNIEPLFDLKEAIKYPQPSNLPASDETRGASISIESINDAIVPLTTQTDDNGHVVLDRCNHATFGTCVHEIFAACPYDGVMSDKEKAKYLETAKHIVRNYGLDRIITDPAALVESLNDLYVWLTNRYGQAYEIVHEYPFNIAINDKQVMHGEIDLIWRCEKGDVVVDYKNFIDPNGDLVEHSKGAYVAQLKAYKNILEKAGRTVVETLLYYDILGKGAIIRYE